jgi:WD40 repeat protein
MIASSGGELAIWTLGTDTLKTLRGHDRPIVSGAWSADGKWVATGDTDGDVRLWEVATGRWRDFRGHAAAVAALAFSPDGKLLASASFDRTLRVWPAAIDARTRLVDHVIGADPAGGVVLANSDDGGLSVLDTATGATRSLPGPRLLSAEIAPDHRHAVVVSGPQNEAPASAVSLGAPRQKALLLDLQTGERRDLMEVTGPTPITWARDSHSFAIGQGDGVHLWDERGTARTLAHGGSPLVALEFSRDGARIAGGDTGGEVIVWQVASGEQRVVGRHRDSVASRLAWSPSGALLASPSLDQSIGLWDGASGKFETLPRSGLCLSVAFSPDGNQLASCCGPEAIQVRDLVHQTERVYRGLGDACDSIRWSDDGMRLVVAARDSTARIFDAVTGESRAIAASGPVSDAWFLPDHQHVGVVDGGFSITREDLPTDPAALRAAIRDELAARQPVAVTR